MSRWYDQHRIEKRIRRLERAQPAGYHAKIVEHMKSHSAVLRCPYRARDHASNSQRRRVTQCSNTDVLARL